MGDQLSAAYIRCIEFDACGSGKAQQYSPGRRPAGVVLPQSGGVEENVEHSGRAAFAIIVWQMPGHRCETPIGFVDERLCQDRVTPHPNQTAGLFSEISDCVLPTSSGPAFFLSR